MEPVDAYYLDLMRVIACSSSAQADYLGSTIPAASHRYAGEIPEGRNGLLDVARKILEVHPVELAGDELLHSKVLALIELMLSSKNFRAWDKNGIHTHPIWNLLRELSSGWLQSVGEISTLPSQSLESLVF